MIIFLIYLIEVFMCIVVLNCFYNVNDFLSLWFSFLFVVFGSKEGFL